MPIDTDLNTFPYYDDFDETKNFHKVLFRPSVPIQARELTQLQSILQNQVERFGDSVYTQGSIIKGCSLFFDYYYSFVKILDLQSDGETVTPAAYSNCFAVDAASNLTAEVVNFVVGSEARDPDTNKLFLSYINTGSSEKKIFANSDTLTIYNKQYTVEKVLITNPGTGYSNDNYLTFTGGGGTGASANLVTDASGSIISISITNKGSGYITAPTVAIVNSTGGITLAGSSGSLTSQNYIAQVTVAGSSFIGNSNTTGTPTATTPVGLASAVYVKEGIIYQKGHFVRVDPQVAIVDPHFGNPNNVVLGFSTSEEIVDSDEDASLLDNATGFSNYTAPGAHRLKLTASLISLTKEQAAANSDFLSIIEFENGSATRRRKDPQLNTIGSILAERTREESGNYVTSPFQLFPEDISGNTTHLNLNIGKGTGYVDGYRVDLLDTIKLPLRKANTTVVTETQSIATNYGNYVLVNQVLGTFVFTSGATLNLRDTAGTAVTSTPGGAATTPGNLIGTAKIRSMVFDSGVIGTPTAVYKIYLFDVRMNQSYSFKNVRSIQMTGGIADCVLEDSVAVLKETEYDFMTFPSGFSSVKQFTNENFLLRRSSNTTLEVTGQATITLSSPESWPYTGSLNDTQELDFVVIPTSNTDSSTNLTGTVTSNSSGGVTGVGTFFVTELDVGDYVKFQANVEHYRIASIANNTVLQLANNGPASVVSANTVKQAFPKNIPINLRRTGSSANVSIAGLTATIFIGKTLTTGNSTSIVVYHNVKASPTTPKSKTVKRSVYVKLSTNTIKNSLKGPWCIGVPDAFKLNGVYVGVSNSYSNTGTNYADSFDLISGQNDNYYGLAYLKLKPGATSPSLSTSSCLTIDVDCFTHDTGYYISAESYLVDDASGANPQNTILTQEIPVFPSSKYGLSYSQRDIVDFRPIVNSTANVTSILSAANTDISNTEFYTVDPSNTETFVTSSVFYPAPNETFSANVEYYLARGDRVVLDVFGNFSIIEGVPSNNPSVPPAPKSTMSLGSVYVPPYPSLGPESAILAKRPDYAVRTKLLQTRNYTMSDIKNIEERINKLEYYSLLNTLEKNTKDLIIPSSANAAVNRFKNGFFADPLTTYDIANPSDSEFSVTIDTTRGGARPQLNQNMFQMEVDLARSSNVNIKGDNVLLDYTDEVYINQPGASRFRNITQARYGYNGSMLLYPPYDNYYDTTRKPVDVTIDSTAGLTALSKAIEDNFVSKADKKVVTTTQTGFKDISASNGGNPGSVITSQNRIDSFTTTTTTDLVPGKIVTEVNEVGGFLTESTLNPYLRAQWVGFIAYGLRPDARHYAYFAKTNVSSSTRPGLVSNTELVSDSTSLIDNPAFSFTGTIGANLVANSSGMVAGAVFIEAGTFFTGQNELIITDVSDVNSLDTATSKATTVFNAFNFKQSATDLSITTKTIKDFAASVVSSDSPVTTTFQTRSRTIPPPPPPAPTCCCFIAGTKILMADGSYRNIEDVMLGDVVLGKDGSRNEVLEFLRPTLGDTGATMMAFNGGTPFMTSDHPVYVRGYGWKSFDPKMTEQKYFMPVGKYQIGDIIETPDGSGFEIKSIEEYGDQDQDQIIYNFRLGGNHTYIADGLVVHNKCFIAGTEVLLEDKTWKKIEDVELDQILIGKDGSKNKILRLHRPKLGINDDWLPHKQRMVSINGSEFATSEDHMFFTTDGWKAPDAESCNLVHKHTIEAEGFTVTDLQLGDDIVTDDGRLVKVNSIEFRDDDPELQLYNFWTNGNHTYHVKMKDSQDGMLVHNKCFVAGTEVLLQDGSWRNIEDVQLDEVLIGKDGSKNKILRLHRPTLGLQDHILPHKLRLACINGKEYSVSEDHIFSTENGWKAPNSVISKIIHKHTIEAEGFDVTNLQVGDNIITHDGRTVEVKSLEFKEDDPNTQLYNFWTDGNHTYHVKMAGHDDSMLVHNKCFIAGTEVLLRDGTWKNIEDIELGDILLGHSGSSNEVVQDHSQPISTRDRQPIWYGFNGMGGFVTAAHPILTKKGWKAVDVAEVKRLEILPNEDVQQLEVGDEMVCKEGESVIITSIEEYKAGPEEIGYNHGLTGDHTYFVRLPGTDKWLIAHNRDPVSQTFQIGIEESIIGTFITKVDIYLKEKPVTPGLTMQLRTTDNGYPSQKVLAEKHLKPSQIQVSDDASLATTFEFDTPAFVASLQEYCVVIIPDGNDPNFFIWTTSPGLPDVTTGIISNADWGDGTMFLGANDRVWTPYQNEDIKFKVYTTKFTRDSGKVTLVNKPYEFLTLTGIEGAFQEGEQVAQKATSYLPGTYSVNVATSTISVNTDLTSLVSAGDYLLLIYGNSRSAAKTGTVTVTAASNVVVGSSTSVNTEYTVGDYILVGSQMREITSLTNTTHLTVDCDFNTSLSGNVHYNIQETFQVNRVNQISYSSPNTSLVMKDFPEKYVDNGTVNSANGYVGVQKVVRAVVDVINNDNTIVLKDSTTSNTTFKIDTGRKIVGSASEAFANVASIDNFKINYTEPHISTFVPPQNEVLLQQNIVQAGSVGYNTSISFGVSNKLPYEGVLKSKSNEVYDADKSIVIQTTLNRSPLTDKIGPVVDIQPVGVVAMSNIINNDITGENTKGGNSDAKYISKKVVLGEGLDAEDIKVYVTANKPPQSEIYVYAKILNGSDSDNFDDKDWSLLVQETPSVYSDSGDENDYLEFAYTFDTAPPARQLPGRANTATISNVITGVSTSFIRQFNSNTDVSTPSDFISLTDANTYFRNGEKVTYFTSASNTVIGGLANATAFFVVDANTSTLKLSSTPNGTAIDLTGNTTATGAATNGHFLSVLNVNDMIKISNTSGYEINFISVLPTSNTSVQISSNALTTASGLIIEKVTQEKAAFKYAVDSKIVRYYDSNKSLQKEYKTYAIKIVLVSSETSFPPTIKDVRAIAVSI